MDRLAQTGRAIGFRDPGSRPRQGRYERASPEGRKSGRNEKNRSASQIRAVAALCRLVPRECGRNVPVSLSAEGTSVKVLSGFSCAWNTDPTGGVPCSALRWDIEVGYEI